MPIRRRAIGDDTLLKSQMQTITNTVNCVGVMGKGVALRIKNAHKANFNDYVGRCNRNEVLPGVPYVFRADPKRDKPQLQLILNFPTKNHWRNPSEIEWVEGGLRLLAERYQDWGITSLAVPPLGCGNGGLQWRDVWPLIDRYLADLPIEVEVWVPNGEDVDDVEGDPEQLDLFSD